MDWTVAPVRYPRIVPIRSPLLARRAPIANREIRVQLARSTTRPAPATGRICWSSRYEHCGHQGRYRQNDEPATQHAVPFPFTCITTVTDDRNDVGICSRSACHSGSWPLVGPAGSTTAGAQLMGCEGRVRGPHPAPAPTGSSSRTATSPGVLISRRNRDRRRPLAGTTSRKGCRAGGGLATYFPRRVRRLGSRAPSA